MRFLYQTAPVLTYSWERRIVFVSVSRRIFQYFRNEEHLRGHFELWMKIEIKDEGHRGEDKKGVDNEES